MNMDNKEKRNKQMGAVVSVGSHVLIILIFLFMVAWRPPDPPLPEIGIELNFGLEDAGSGADQPEPNTQPADTDSEDEATPDGLEETHEEVVEESVENVTEPVESDDIPTEEVISTVENTQESPDIVEEKPDPVEEKEEKEQEREEEVKKEEEQPKLPPVLYPNNKTGAGGKEGDASDPQNANQGDQPDAKGDQGDEDGAVDSQNLNGNAGGGGGTSLNMSDWEWDYKPDPDYPKSLNQSGKIVFQVVIDDKGNIIRVITKTNTVSPTLKKIYEDEVWKLSFSKTPGTSVASTSTGTITFIIKANK
jgi:periplasmic protein TonB